MAPSGVPRESNGHVRPRQLDGQAAEHDSEATPLLRRNDDESTRGGEHKQSRWKRWPSLVALAVLSTLVIVILVLAFIIPQTIQEYALEALVVEPTSLSIDSFTPTGVIARIRADFTMDASRVRRKPVRDLGRFGTWIAREAETEATRVKVSLPGYGNAVLGMADIPALKVNVRNGHTTPIDLLTEIQPGAKDALRHVADDFIAGKLHEVQLAGHADVAIRSGLISIGTQSIAKSFVLKNDDIPTMPKYNISGFNFREIKAPEGPGGIAAEVSLQVANKYPFEFKVPPLGFAILVPACSSDDPYIMLADATTGSVQIQPKEDLSLNITGYVRRLPEALTTACPGSKQSPLDTILGEYMHGDATTIYVRGSDAPSVHTPKWITDLISGITVPVPFTGHSFGKLLRKFTLQDVKFSLPEPDAEPDSPEAQPKISATIKALVALPKEMNFPINVSRVRASADVFYQKRKLGFLQVQDWRNATSTPTEIWPGGLPGLEVASRLQRAPLTVTDEDVFTEVLQEIVFKRHGVNLTVNAKVDVELHTALGTFVVRQIPGEGVVLIKPILRGGPHGPGVGKDLISFLPKLYDLRISDTTEQSITLDVLMNLTNPTEYAATVPYMDVNILVNDTIMGHATARNISVGPGNNTGIPIRAVWEPAAQGGVNGNAIGRELLSQYISGYNTTLTIRPHALSIPAQPNLSRVLSSMNITLPTPHLGVRPPSSDPPTDPSDPSNDPESEKPHFITSATMHLITSTSTFTVLSPFKSTTLYLTHINATAFHEEAEGEMQPVGKILYNGALAVPPGESTTPKLPVSWSLDSVGYRAVREALGGTLRLAAEAEVGVRIGRFEVGVWYKGGGIGAKVRL